MRNALLSLLVVLTGAALAPAHAAPDPADKAPAPAPGVDVAAEAEPLRDVLRRLQQRHRLNYVVSEDALAVAKKVTVHLQGVPLADAVQAICAAVGLEIEVQGPILVIVPRQGAGAGPAAAHEPPQAEPAPGPAVRRALPLPRQPGPVPTTRSTPGVVELMATGDVLEVDLPNRRLQLEVGGVKRDFYLPGEHEADPYQRSARLGQALASLAPGSRVALLYRRDDNRSVITNMIGGDRIAEQDPAYQPRPTQAAPRGVRPPPAPQGARTAPEATQVPEGVVVGRFARRDQDRVLVRLANEEIMVCFLPPADAGERREKVLAVIDALQPDARVFFRYEVVDGKRRLLDTGITEVR